MTRLSERQFEEVGAMLLIGDGVLGVLRPSAHCAVWRTNYSRWNAAVDWFAARPALVRACGALEIAAGVWLAERQFSDLPEAILPATGVSDEDSAPRLT